MGNNYILDKVQSDMISVADKIATWKEKSKIKFEVDYNKDMKSVSIKEIIEEKVI